MKPDMTNALRYYLSSENFSSPAENAPVLIRFIDRFELLKNESLYQNTSILRKDVLHEYLATSNLKQAIKLACIFKNQELQEYMAAEMARLTELKKNKKVQE